MELSLFLNIIIYIKFVRRPRCNDESPRSPRPCTISHDLQVQLLKDGHEVPVELTARTTAAEEQTARPMTSTPKGGDKRGAAAPNPVATQEKVRGGVAQRRQLNRQHFRRAPKFPDLADLPILYIQYYYIITKISDPLIWNENLPIYKVNT